MNHVGAYVDRLTALGVKPPRVVVEQLTYELARLKKEKIPDEQIARGIEMLADKGSAPQTLPYLLVEAARRADRAALAAYLDAYPWPTGARFIRGSHAGTCVYDVLGTDRPPADWPFERPGRKEVEEMVKALDALGTFFSRQRE